MKKRSILLLFISLMFLALNACTETGLPTMDFKYEIDKYNPLKVSFSTEIPSTKEYGDLTLAWDLGDGTIVPTDEEITHTYEKQGEYKVKLSLISSKEFIGISETVKTLDLNIVIKNFDYSYSIPDNDSPLEVYFKVLGDIENGVLEYKWDFGDNTTDNIYDSQMEFIKTFSELDIYKVALTASIKDTDYVAHAEKDIDLNIKVNDIKWESSQLGNDLLRYLFNALPTPDMNGLIYEWDFGDNVSDPEQKNVKSPRHKFPRSGKYMVTVKAKAKETDPWTTYSNELVVGPQLGDIDFTYTSSSTKPLDVTFSGVSNPEVDGIKYEWDFGNGFTTSQQTFTHLFSEYGDHCVTMRATIGGSNNPKTICKRITVDVPIIEDLGFTYTKVPDKPLTIIAEAKDNSTFDGITYQWRYEHDKITTGKTATINFKNYNTTPLTLEVYIDDILIDNNTIIDNITIPPPLLKNVDFTMEPIREDEKLIATFDATGYIEKQPFLGDNTTFEYEIMFEWNFEGEIKTGQKVIHEYPFAGTYPVTMRAIIVGTDIDKTVTHDKIIKDGSLADFQCIDYDTNTMDNLTYNCTANIASVAKNPVFEWIVTGKDGLVTKQTGKSIDIKFNKLGKYTVMLKIEDYIFENGNIEIPKVINVLTYPEIHASVWVDRKNIDCEWSPRGELYNNWSGKVTQDVDVTVEIIGAHNPDANGVHDNKDVPHPPSYLIIGKIGKYRPWKVTVNTMIHVTYSIDGKDPHKSTKYLIQRRGPNHCFWDDGE